MKKTLTVFAMVLCLVITAFLLSKRRASAVASAQPVVQAQRTLDDTDLRQATLFYQWAERLDYKFQVTHNDEEHQVDIRSVKAVPGHYICAELYLRPLKQTGRYVLAPDKTVPLAVDEGAEGDKTWQIMECNSDSAIEVRPKN